MRGARGSARGVGRGPAVPAAAPLRAVPLRGARREGHSGGERGGGGGGARRDVAVRAPRPTSPPPRPLLLKGHARSRVRESPAGRDVADGTPSSSTPSCAFCAHPPLPSTRFPPDLRHRGRGGAEIPGGGVAGPPSPGALRAPPRHGCRGRGGRSQNEIGRGDSPPPPKCSVGVARQRGSPPSCLLGGNVWML